MYGNSVRICAGYMRAPGYLKFAGLCWTGDRGVHVDVEKLSYVYVMS